MLHRNSRFAEARCKVCEGARRQGEPDRVHQVGIHLHIIDAAAQPVDRIETCWVASLRSILVTAVIITKRAIAVLHSCQGDLRR